MGLEFWRCYKNLHKLEDQLFQCSVCSSHRRTANRQIRLQKRNVINMENLNNSDNNTAKNVKSKRLQRFIVFFYN